MRWEADSFIFQPPPIVARARRILIKPSASYPLLSPSTTSRGILAAVINGIRRVSEADIILIEGPQGSESARDVFHQLDYTFPRVQMIDVRDCMLVEVENPLPKPFALPTVWVPNIILSCDYLISVAPCKIVGGKGSLTVKNLLSLLAHSKYGEPIGHPQESLLRLGLDRVAADLYFTIPFDIGIVDATKMLLAPEDGAEGVVDEVGQVFLDEPYQVDYEVSQHLRIETPYLKLIEMARAELIT